MKKFIIMTLAFFVLIFPLSAVSAYDTISDFALEKDELTISPGSTYRVNFLFEPKGKIGEVYLAQGPEFTPDTSIADVTLYDDHMTVTGKKVGTTQFVLIGAYHNEFGSSRYRYLTVKVIEDPISLSASIKEIDTIDPVNVTATIPITVTLTPADKKDMLSYYSEDPSIAKIENIFKDTEFDIYIYKAGTTKIHIQAGTKEIIIPVTVRARTSENLYDLPVVPKEMTKADVKKAYDTYLKQYNTPFQHNGVFNDFIDDTVENDVLSAANLKKASNIHNFLLRVSGSSHTVAYTEANSKKAQPGADFMKSRDEMGHDIADGIDKTASDILHSSNLAIAHGGISSLILGMYSDIGNRAGVDNVGHRLYMQGSFKEWGLAKAGRYWAQYYNYSSSDQTNQTTELICFPSSGYFPIEALDGATTKWSIGGDFIIPYPKSNPVKVTVTDDTGRTIELPHFKDNPNDPRGYYSSTVIYPKQFVYTETGGDPKKLVGRSYTVRIEGLEHVRSMGETVPVKPLEYTVKFFSIIDEGWFPKIESFEILDATTNKAIDSTISLKPGETIKLKSKISPSQYQKEANDYFVARLGENKYRFDYTIDNETGIISLTPKQNGTYPIEIVLVTPNEIKRPITINVSESGASTDDNNNSEENNTDGNNNGSSGSQTSTKGTKIFRLYNSVSGEHLFTTDQNEVKVLDAMPDWHSEGTAWTAPTSGEGIFRLYSPITGNHLYTKDKNEINVLTGERGWTIDYSATIPLFYSGGNVPVYRLYNEGLKQHLLTTDSNENNVLVNYGWRQEGVGLKALSIQ